MGFSAEDSLTALHSTDGQLDAALVLLTSPVQPSKASETFSPINPPSSRTVGFLRNLIDQITPSISEISVSCIELICSLNSI